MHTQTFVHPPNVDCLMHSIEGFIVVAEMMIPKTAVIIGSQPETEIKRFHGFFDNKQEMEEFVKNSKAKIVAIKKMTVSYYDGQGLNYA